MLDANKQSSPTARMGSGLTLHSLKNTVIGSLLAKLITLQQCPRLCANLQLLLPLCSRGNPSGKLLIARDEKFIQMYVSRLSTMRRCTEEALFKTNRGTQLRDGDDRNHLLFNLHRLKATSPVPKSSEDQYWQRSDYRTRRCIHFHVRYISFCLSVSVLMQPRCRLVETLNYEQRPPY